jgi:2-polyprenyl-3-methyl-5-hydroxy-6-metoxy-1,4-benzoquinol methylase
MDLDRFGRFVAFFCARFKDPALLDGVACTDSFRRYVLHYYRKTFGPGVASVEARHRKWFRRLRPVLELPRGSTIVDFGGGYGLDSIFLASLGYRVSLYEVTMNHIAIALHFKAAWERAFGPILMDAVLARKTGDEALQNVDAILFDEVAHHIEPVGDAFRKASRMLRPGGQVFLLEPNFLCLPTQVYFYNVRGFNTVCERTDPETGEKYLYGNEHIRTLGHWNRIARAAGLQVKPPTFIVPYGLSAASMNAGWRSLLERTPLLRLFVSSHITHRFQKP